MTKKILTLDLSLRSSGFSIWNNDELEDYGVIQTKKDPSKYDLLDILTRCHEIGERIEDIVACCDFNHIVIEQVTRHKLPIISQKLGFVHKTI